MMFAGLGIFVLIFLVLTPGPRATMAASLQAVAGWLISWAPFSFILLALLLVMAVVSIYLMKTWPVREEPENPMAKYRREVIDDGE
ncbi:MAG: hypothetical protein KGN36_04095 [Acidobacteriota bacterium]|nr:hypothetical protein [Acidobacteriota bacterium]